MNLKGGSHGFPAKWQIKNLGEICNISTGKLNANAAVENGKYPFFTCSREIFSIDHFTFDCEAILLAGNNAVGDFNVKYYKGKFNAYQRTYVITVNKGESLLYKYLYLQVENALKDFKIKSVGAGTKFLKLDMIKNLEIHIPPLPEQKRIVAILDEVFEGIDRAIANTEKNLIHARELFEGYLNKIFTQKGDVCEEKTLRDVSSEFGRGKSKHRPRNDPKLYGDSYPFIQTGDVRNCNHFITRNSQFYSEVGLAQSKLWPKGTICITIAANIAETGILGFDACFPDSIIGIVVDDKITSNNFVEYLLQSVKARIKAKGQGSAQNNINLATFENERFPFPSLEQQKNLVSKLNKLSSETQRLESIYRQKLTALNELKQSILQKAFTGELTANTANLTVKTAEEEIAA
jgi:type I restriction enzyme, S subunit